MNKHCNRKSLFGTASLHVVMIVGMGCWGSSANAETACSVTSSDPMIEFSCDDGGAATTPTIGTLSAGSNLTSGGALINVYDNRLATELTLEGGLLDTASQPVVTLRSIGGTLDYSSTATTRTTEGFNTVLVADSISAQLGTTIVDGGRGYGLYSIAENGDNFVRATSTSVTAPLGIGLVAYATNGDIVLDTGAVDAEADGSWGVYTQTKAGDSCGTNTVNVSGNIASSNWGVRAESCGAGTVNVQAGTEMTRTEGWGAATILNGATTSATTNINGTVAAMTAGELVLHTWGADTATTIGSTGRLSGSLIMSDANDVFTIQAGGLWETAGESWFEGGSDVVNNAGTIRSEYGSTSLEGLNLLKNSGSIDLQGGAVGDTFFIAGDYVGTAGRLLVDVGDGVSDQLVIAGTASGTTDIFVNYVGTQPLDMSGLTLVNAASGADSSFQLIQVTGNTSKLVGYHMVERDGSLVLVAAPGPVSLQVATVAPGVSAIWQQSADQIWTQTGLRRTELGEARQKAGFWGALYLGHDREGHVRSPSLFGFEIEQDGRVTTDRKGVQAGIDVHAGDGVFLGVTGGYEEADLDGRGEDAGMRATGFNIGAYARLTRRDGLHAAVLAKFDRTNVRLKDNAFDLATHDPDSSTWGVEAEAGYSTAVGSVRVDTAAGLSYISSNIDGFSVDGVSVDFRDTRTLRGKLGVRGEFGGKLGAFADAKLFHEFGRSGDLHFTSGAQADQTKIGGRGTWGRIEIGLGSNPKSALTASAWGEVGSVTGLGAVVGIHF